MHTKTQSSESYYRPGIWTEQGDNHHNLQTVHQIRSRIVQHQLVTKPLRHTLQGITGTAKQHTENRNRLYQNIPTDHLHRETKILKIRDHMDLKGAQLYDRIESDPSHPLHHTLHTAPTHRNIRNTPSTYYPSILDIIQQHLTAQVTPNTYTTF